MNYKKTKRCSACRINKPLNEFYRAIGYKDDVNSRCKVCLKKYRHQNKEKIRLQHKRWYATKERKKRDFNLYGLNKQQYDNLLQKQNSCCGICGKHYTEFPRRLGVDHNHLTGIVRGLLCRTCNLAISLLDSDSSVTLFYAAIKYLK